MKTDAEIIREIEAILEPRHDFACDKLLELAKAVVEARYYNGDDGWDRLKNAIGDLEDFITPPRK